MGTRYGRGVARCARSLCLGVVWGWWAAQAMAEWVVVDAHSQFDHEVSAEQVLQTLRSAGVARVVLATRGQAEIGTLTAMAQAHPGCVVPMVRTKSNAYERGSKGYYRQLEEQLGHSAFTAMAELILTHAQKGERAEQVLLPASAPQVQVAIQAARARGWPVVLHYEFQWIAKHLGAAEHDRRMQELRGLLRALAPLPVGLTHVAQLSAPQAEILLQEFPHLYLLLSHTHSLVTRKSKQPWTTVVDGDSIAPEWARLMERFPLQFVLALDNVFPEHWSGLYAEQVTSWRRALQAVEPAVAQAIAAENAQRIYRLPAWSVGSCVPLPHQR